MLCSQKASVSGAGEGGQGRTGGHLLVEGSPRAPEHGPDEVRFHGSRVCLDACGAECGQAQGRP